MKRNELILATTSLLLALIGAIFYIGAVIFFAISSPLLFGKVVGLMVLARIFLGASKAILKAMDGE